LISNSASRRARTYFLAFLAALATAFALDVLAWAIRSAGAAGGLVLGLWTGVGFSAMAFATTHLFEHKPIGLWLIVSGYQVVYQVAAAIILTLWRWPQRRRLFPDGSTLRVLPLRKSDLTCVHT
jgi:hypothetical protein